MYDVIIIGGGPAGITAGIYSARLKLNTLLVTKEFGGQVGKKAVPIENYTGFKNIMGPELSKKMEEHLKSFDVDIEVDKVNEVKKTNGGFLVLTSGGKELKAKTVIVATGSDPRPLEVPGEKEFIGKGVSYCAVCDGPIFAGKTVVVIGGGNSGFETAQFMTKHAEKVYILEYSKEVAADKTNQEIIKKAGNTEIITGAALREIKGDNFVNSIIFEKEGEKKELDVQGVFVEIGYQPATAFVKGLVDFSETDEIIVDPLTGQTSTPGLFAAGDVNSGTFKQIIIAAGEGANAALAAFNYLKKNE